MLIKQHLFGVQLCQEGSKEQQLIIIIKKIIFMNILHFHDEIPSEIIEQFKQQQYDVEYEVKIPQNKVLENKINLLNHLKRKKSQKQPTNWLLVGDQNIFSTYPWKAVILYKSTQNNLPTKLVQDLIEKIPIITITKVQQINGIIQMNQQTLKKRWKFEKMQIKALIKYELNKSYQLIRKFGLELMQKNNKTIIKKATQWINYAKMKRVNTLKRYFLYWNIFKSQHIIQSYNSQIIQKQYLVQKKTKAMKRKIFEAMKLILLGKQTLPQARYLHDKQLKQ